MTKILMYCVVAMESFKKMKGNRGKLAAQAGHAYLHAYWDAELRFDATRFSPYRHSGKAYKVCLVVDTVEELKALEASYRPICGVSLVTDAGITCFDGEPTVTCLGIGPIRAEDRKEDLQTLKVFM